MSTHTKISLLISAGFFLVQLLFCFITHSKCFPSIKILSLESNYIYKCFQFNILNLTTEENQSHASQAKKREEHSHTNPLSDLIRAKDKKNVISSHQFSLYYFFFFNLLWMQSHTDTLSNLILICEYTNISYSLLHRRSIFETQIHVWAQIRVWDAEQIKTHTK